MIALLGSVPALAQPATPAAPFDESIALESVARSFFLTGPAASQPASLTVTKVRHVDRYIDGFVYQTYDVRDASGANLGKFTRIQVFVDTASRIDFAVRLDEGRISRVEPLRPVVLGGKPFPVFPQIFSALDHAKPARYAHGLSRFFSALALLEPASAGPPKPLSTKRTPGTTPLITISQPSLNVGDPLPAFSGATYGGGKASDESLAGAPALVLFADLAQQHSREVLQDVAGSIEGLKEPRLQLVLVNDAEAVAEHARYAGEADTLLSAGLLDPEAKVRKSFKAPILPYLYFFDRKSRLRLGTFWRGHQHLSEELAKSVKEPEK